MPAKETNATNAQTVQNALHVIQIHIRHYYDARITMNRTYLCTEMVAYKAGNTTINSQGEQEPQEVQEVQGLLYLKRTSSVEAVELKEERDSKPTTAIQPIHVIVGGYHGFGSTVNGSTYEVQEIVVRFNCSIFDPDYSFTMLPNAS